MVVSHESVIVDIQVLALTDAHHGNWCAFFADEDQRVKTRRSSEFGNRYRYSMGLPQERERLFDLFDAKASMSFCRQRLRLLVEHHGAGKVRLSARWRGCRCCVHVGDSRNCCRIVTGNSHSPQHPKAWELQSGKGHISPMKLRFPASMRSVFQGAFSGLAVLSLAAACTPAVDDAGTPRRIARQVDDLMASIAANELADNPEMATRLGLSEDATGYDFNAYLTDRSQAAFERTRVKRLEILEALLAAPRPVEGGQQARHLDTVIQAYETAESLFVAGHGQTGAASRRVAGRAPPSSG